VAALGIAHLICGSTVGNNLHKDFPHLKVEAFDEKSKGMNAFIQEYILNLDVLEKIDSYKEVGGSNAERSDADGPDTPSWVKGNVV
jgi:hypothetical protein